MSTPPNSKRLARVARVRELQKRQALAAQAVLTSRRTSLTTMLARVDSLRGAYTPKSGNADAMLLKGMAHQHGRLQRPRDNTVTQTNVVDAQLAGARAATLDAHLRSRAAAELHVRAAMRELRDADRRADRQAPLARPLREALS